MLSQSGKTGLMDSGQIPRPAMDDSAKPHGYPGRNRGVPTNEPQRVIVFTTSNSKNWTDDTKFNEEKVKNKITQMLCTQVSGDRDWALTGNERVRSPRRSLPCPAPAFCVLKYSIQMVKYLFQLLTGESGKSLLVWVKYTGAWR